MDLKFNFINPYYEDWTLRVQKQKKVLNVIFVDTMTLNNL